MGDRETVTFLPERAAVLCVVCFLLSGFVYVSMFSNNTRYKKNIYFPSRMKTIGMRESDG